MFLTAQCREKVWTPAGPKFGIRKGKLLIIKQSLYGLEYSVADFREFLAEQLYDIGFKSSISDPYVWMRTATKHTRDKYYEYILCYVDN